MYHHVEGSPHETSVPGISAVTPPIPEPLHLESSSESDSVEVSPRYAESHQHEEREDPSSTVPVSSQGSC